MKMNKLFVLAVLTTLLFLPGCDIIAGIFKAGFWTAIILVGLIVGLALYGYKKFRK